jgi:hypothetical protein
MLSFNLHPGKEEGDGKTKTLDKRKTTGEKSSWVDGEGLNLCIRNIKNSFQMHPAWDSNPQPPDTYCEQIEVWRATIAPAGQQIMTRFLNFTLLTVRGSAAQRCQVWTGIEGQPQASSSATTPCIMPVD